MSKLGLKRGSVALQPYRSDWPKLFETEKQNLLKVLPGVTDIEHIGSTAVPGLSAKPIIDMQAAVNDLSVYKSFIEVLKKLGYEYLPERVFEDRVFFPKGSNESRTHHLNLVIKNSKQWNDSLLFRDYLRLHPEVKEKYLQLKQQLAKQHPDDRESYTKAKDMFIQSILKEAHAA